MEYGGWDPVFNDDVLAGASYSGSGLEGSVELSGIPVVSCARVYDDLHVALVDGAGELWHAIWDPGSAGWVQPFESVHGALGFSQPFTQASLAGL